MTVCHRHIFHLIPFFTHALGTPVIAPPERMRFERYRKRAFMSEENRCRLIAEIEEKLQEFLDSDEISEERKTEVLRELLTIAVTEQ